jgi:transposase
MIRKGKRRCDQLPVLHPDAAGIDIGASELFVAVPAERDADPVRSFATFTRDLNALADWLQRCGVRSVAMESTSVYWIPVYQILESRGFEVYLVNAHHVKNVPGRKTDVSDCQWIQYLHSVGLLRGSFSSPCRDLRHSISLAASRQPDSDGGRTRLTYAESFGPDECADPSCSQRHYRC